MRHWASNACRIVEVPARRSPAESQRALDLPSVFSFFPVRDGAPAFTLEEQPSRPFDSHTAN